MSRNSVGAAFGASAGDRDHPARASEPSKSQREAWAEMARMMALDHPEGDFVDFRSEPIEAIEADNIVFLHIRNRCRGKRTGVIIVAHEYMLWTFRDGSVVKVDRFDRRTEALRALEET
jgi:hypothetical protein